MTAQDKGLHLSIEMQITIRKMKQEDLPGLEWYGQFTHFRRVFKRSYNEQLKGNRLLLVADCNDFPVARLFIQFINAGALSDGKKKGYLFSFHVMEMFQGRGIGSYMLRVAENILQKRGYEVATIAVSKENQRALCLYKREGYTICGQNDGYWEYHDHNGRLKQVREPAWLLEKNLT